MKDIRSISFNLEEFCELRQYLEEASGQPVKQSLLADGHELHLHNILCDLYLRCSPECGLTISRIAMPLPHHGQGTHVLLWLKNYAITHDLCQLIIEHTTTPEVLAFCHKHNFEPTLIGCLDIVHGEVYGNYVLKLKQAKQ